MVAGYSEVKKQHSSSGVIARSAVYDEAISYWLSLRLLREKMLAMTQVGGSR
jgi:hypothetical protein